MVVALSFYTPSVDEDELLFLDIDLNTGQSRDILHVSFPDAFLWGSLQLSGDFFICYAGQTIGSWHVLLMNWRTESFVLLDRNGDNQTIASFAILPGHLVLVHSASEPPTHTIHLHSLAIFDHLWRPLSEFSLGDSIDPTGLVFAQLSVPDNGRQQSFPTLTVAESPRHDDTWELLIHVRDYVPPAPRPRLGSLLQRFRIRTKRNPKSIPPVTVSRFLITLPRGQSSPSALPQITPTTVFRHSKDFWYTSSAGYGLYSEPGAEIRFFIQQLDEERVRTPRSLNLYSPMRVQLTQSGTVLVADGSRAMLLYYM
ncbi:hypothetical protein MVEN_00601900 [Mycena venus]|uniref:Uncharacterized protein n=1 Tax=Mycena venus TaxID=2733690 RepID=A0A8H6YQ78_9AGAR|nr:hypothetical protein MVEN_00601900 [Mycena venus]